jgi:hypothetical protein
MSLLRCSTTRRTECSFYVRLRSSSLTSDSNGVFAFSRWRWWKWRRHLLLDSRFDCGCCFGFEGWTLVSNHGCFPPCGCLSRCDFRLSFPCLIFHFVRHVLLLRFHFFLSRRQVFAGPSPRFFETGIFMALSFSSTTESIIFFAITRASWRIKSLSCWRSRGDFSINVHGGILRVGGQHDLFGLFSQRNGKLIVFFLPEVMIP